MKALALLVVALCALSALCSPASAEAPAAYAAWQGSTPVAPPPAVVLRAPPPPELEPLEYARRPVELAAELLFGLPSCSAGSASDARCDGLGAGLGWGLGALWRVSPYFAFGGTFNALRFRFDPPSSAGLQDTSAGGLFVGLLGRVYFLDHGPIEPYLELGLGGGEGRTRAREADARQYDETSTGGALRIGGAVELFLGRHLRLGPALDWTRFRVRHVERCDPADQCADLDQASEGHGIGFTTLSARLTILIGPGQ